MQKKYFSVNSIQVTSVLNIQQHWKFNNYLFIVTHWKYLSLWAGSEWLVEPPFTDLSAFIAHYIGMGALLYLNSFEVNFIQGSALFQR